MGSDEPPFLTSCLVLSLYSSVKFRLHRTPCLQLATEIKHLSLAHPFLSEYLVDLKSWSTSQDPKHNLARNGRGQ